jgi:hypothetical protein
MARLRALGRGLHREVGTGNNELWPRRTAKRPAKRRSNCSRAIVRAFALAFRQLEHPATGLILVSRQSKCLLGWFRKCRIRPAQIRRLERLERVLESNQLCGANSFDYLTELQRHARELTANPAQWMPWNYRETLAQIEV